MDSQARREIVAHIKGEGADVSTIIQGPDSAWKRRIISGVDAVIHKLDVAHEGNRQVLKELKGIIDSRGSEEKTENLFLTPHYAGGSNFTASEGSKRWAENAVNVLTGQKLWGLANPDVKRVITIMRTKGANKWDNIPDPVTDFDFM